MPICPPRPNAHQRKAPSPVSRRSRARPRPGTYTVSLSAGGWVDVVQDGHSLKPRAFSGATDCDGIRKTMKYELSASPFVLQITGSQSRFSFGCDPAIGIGQGGRALPKGTACYCFTCDIRTDRKSSDQRNGASACRIPHLPTPVCVRGLRPRTRMERHDARLAGLVPPSPSCSGRPARRRAPRTRALSCLPRLR